MNTRIALLWFGTLTAGSCALAWSAHRHCDARARVASETIHLQHVRAQIEQILSLPVPFEYRDPLSRRTLAARVADVMSASALPRGSLESLSPETARATPGAASLPRRSATLTLGSVTLPDLGRFLSTWREREPTWTIIALDLKPRRDNTSTGDLPLRVVLTLERMDIHALAPHEPQP